MSVLGYDHSNIFARILRKEVPATVRYENENVLAIDDIHPKAPVHVLFLPKGQFLDFDHFCHNALGKEILDFFRAIPKFVNHELSQQDSKCHELKNYTIKINTVHAPEEKQEVLHLHAHVLSGDHSVVSTAGNMHAVYREGVIHAVKGKGIVHIYSDLLLTGHEFLQKASDFELLEFIYAVQGVTSDCSVEMNAINLTIYSGERIQWKIATKKNKSAA